MEESEGFGSKMEGECWDWDEERIEGQLGEERCSSSDQCLRIGLKDNWKKKYVSNLELCL